MRKAISRCFAAAYRGGGLDKPCPRPRTAAYHPAVVTPEELEAGPNRLAVKMWVNEELRQDSTTADLIWPVEEMVSRTSQYLSLWPGDIIATGSPPGTVLETGKYLKEGDLIQIEIGGVGVLENPVGPPR